MSSIARGRGLFAEPKCATCDHWRVVHKGDQHIGKCVAIDCACPAFVPSAPGSSPHCDPREGSLGKPAADPDEPRAVSTSAPLLIPSEAESVSSRESVGNTATPHVVPSAQVRQIASRLK